ncbi:MAG TPA: hypothetical protein VKA32_02960 [Gammaproteobacteria bacterium]|nr:hypothetical protein [Gammaproteobacteria bacterium]
MRRHVVAFTVLAVMIAATPPAAVAGDDVPAATGCLIHRFTDQPEAGRKTLEFSGQNLERVWERVCDNARADAYVPRGSGMNDWSRMVTVNVYPPGPDAQAYLKSYLDRVRPHLAGKPRVFQSHRDHRERFLAEMLVQPPGGDRLEYILHGVTSREGAPPSSYTYSYRFDPDDQAAFDRLKKRQADWLKALQGLVDGD